jgi:hypothetical protein
MLRESLMKGIRFTPLCGLTANAASVYVIQSASFLLAQSTDKIPFKTQKTLVVPSKFCLLLFVQNQHTPGHFRCFFFLKTKFPSTDSLTTLWCREIHASPNSKLQSCARVTTWFNATARYDITEKKAALHTHTHTPIKFDFFLSPPFRTFRERHV